MGRTVREFASGHRPIVDCGSAGFCRHLRPAFHGPWIGRPPDSGLPYPTAGTRRGVFLPHLNRDQLLRLGSGLAYLACRCFVSYRPLFVYCHSCTPSTFATSSFRSISSLISILYFSF